MSLDTVSLITQIVASAFDVLRARNASQSSPADQNQNLQIVLPEKMAERGISDQVDTSVFGNLLSNLQSQDSATLDKENVRRENLIGRIINVSTNLAQLATDPSMLEESSEVSTKFLRRIYCAQGEAEFDLIEMGINHLETVIKNEEQLQLHQRERETEARKRAFWVSGVAVGAVILIVLLGPRYGLEADTVIPILQLPFAIAFWSVIGSFAAILYRFNTTDTKLQEPTRWLITRPLIGVLMGIIAYYAINIGFIALTPNSGTEITVAPQVLWLAAFIVSFSDQLAEKFLKTIAGKFGNDVNEGLFKRFPEEKAQEHKPILNPRQAEKFLPTTSQQQATQDEAVAEEKGSEGTQTSSENDSSTSEAAPTDGSEDGNGVQKKHED